MELSLDRGVIEWQAKARAFAEEELQPWELEAEFNNGVIPAEVRERHRRLAVELGFSVSGDGFQIHPLLTICK